jgi:hypothetical protein
VSSRTGVEVTTRGLAPVLALLLAACSSDAMRQRERSEQAYAAPPVNPRVDILAFMRTYLNDPTRVRDAFLSEPVLRPIDGVNRYSVCVRYNARDGSGRYTGSKDSLVLFRDGRLDRMIDSAREHCRDQKLLPFPELERMTR